MLKLTIESQIDWMQTDYEEAQVGGSKHTFVFTHCPIVGHDGGATHNDILGTDYDLPFVEWVNEVDMTGEVVFYGHTHQDHIFYDVTSSIMGEPIDLLDEISIDDTAYIGVTPF